MGPTLSRGLTAVQTNTPVSTGAIPRNFPVNASGPRVTLLPEPSTEFSTELSWIRDTNAEVLSGKFLEGTNHVFYLDSWQRSTN